MIARRSFLAASALAALLTAGLPLAARADAGADARQFVQTMADQAIATAAARNLSQAERLDRFRTLFVANFDLPEIAREDQAYFFSGSAGAGGRAGGRSLLIICTSNSHWFASLRAIQRLFPR